MVVARERIMWNTPVYRSNAKPYVQCWLVRGNRSQVSWIPQRLAFVDNVLRLRKEGTEEWEDGWVVASTYQTSLQMEDVERARRTFARKLK